MTHSRDGTKKELVRIRGKTRDDPGRQLQWWLSTDDMLIFNSLTGQKWLEREDTSMKNERMKNEECAATSEVNFLNAKNAEKTLRTLREKV